jgi:hypothetical protein
VNTLHYNWITLLLLIAIMVDDTLTESGTSTTASGASMQLSPGVLASLRTQVLQDLLQNPALLPWNCAPDFPVVQPKGKLNQDSNLNKRKRSGVSSDTRPIGREGQHEGSSEEEVEQLEEHITQKVGDLESGDSSTDDSESEGEPLEEATTLILRRASDDQSNSRLVKKIYAAKKFAKIESGYLEALERDDDLECAASTGPGGNVYSPLMDNRFKEASQAGLDSLKPWISLFQEKDISPKIRRKIKKGLRQSAALIFKSSGMLRKARLTLILRQNYPKLCKQIKVENLVRQLTKGTALEPDQTGLLAGGQFGKKLKEFRKIDLATKEYSGNEYSGAPRNQVAGPSGLSTGIAKPSFKTGYNRPFNNGAQGSPQHQQQQWRPPNPNMGRFTGESYSAIFSKIFGKHIQDWTGVSAAGRVAKALSAWREISSDDWVLQTVSGFSLLFFTGNGSPVFYSYPRDCL